jgi:anti-sigma-K factor RskA
VDTKEYKENGIIERYILGDVSSQERREVECLSHIYPEIKAEIEASHEALHNLAVQFKVTPPSDIKEKILSAIQKEKQIDTDRVLLNTSPPSKERNLKIHSISTPYWAAASFLLASFSTYLIFTNFKNKQQLQTKTLALQNDKKVLSQQLNLAQSNIKMLGMATDEHTQKITLNGTEKHPTAKILAFWNTNQHLLCIKGVDLPENDAKTQYQIWAIIQGKPVSIGVFDKKETDTMLQVKYVDQAEAFAVTLEPIGGSELPTLDNMYSIAKLL